MNIFEQITKSIYSPDYYAEVRNEKFSTSLAYSISLALIVSVIATGLVSVRIFPMVKTALTNFGPEIASRFPEDLVVSVKGGVIATNQSDPVAIPLHLGSSTPGLPTNFLVIDTREGFDESRFRNASTLLFLTTDTIYFGNESGKMERAEKLELPDITINRALVLEWLGDLGPILSWVPFLIVFAIFFTALWFSSLLLLELFIAALFIMLASRSRGPRLNYKESYQTALHAVTPRVLFGLVAALGSGAVVAIALLPLLGVVVSLLIFILNTPKGNQSPLI